MSYPKEGGIYIIRGPGGKVYVGSAKSFRVRWNRHKTDLRRGVSKQPKLLAAWQKYGEACFTFGIVERVSDLDLLLEREQFWLDWLFKTLPATHIYNTARMAGNTTGYKHTAEDRARMSEIKKSNPKTNEIIKLAVSASMAIRQTREYGDSVARTNGKGNLYTFISPSGEIFTDVFNISGFAKEHGLHTEAFRHVAKGRVKQHKGWKGFLQESKLV